MRVPGFKWRKKHPPYAHWFGLFWRGQGGTRRSRNAHFKYLITSGELGYYQTVKFIVEQGGIELPTADELRREIYRYGLTPRC